MKHLSHHMTLSIFLVLFLPTIGIGATVPEKVTTHPALDYFAAPSQDGRFLAFVSERSGNADIWLKSLAAGTVSLPRQLTTHPAVDRDPALNADGTQLLYVSHKTDPRGDIYHLDLITGEEIQLTDLRSGDSTPQWGPDGQSIFYLKQDLETGNQRVYRQTLGTQEEQEVLSGTSAFSVGPGDWVVYTKEGTLRILNPPDQKTDSAVTSETFLDSWPSLAREPSTTSGNIQAILFTRYEEDTNQDGVLDTDDESSLWFTRWDQSTHQTVALYRLTPSGQFHVYPSSAGDYGYFSDLQKGDIFRLHVKDFLQDYASFETAKELGTLYRDRGQRDLGLLLSRNHKLCVLGR